MCEVLGAGLGHTVMRVQGVQYGVVHATLVGSCVQSEVFGGVFVHPDGLGPGG